MAGSHLTVTAVIVNWNGLEDTVKCIEALQQIEKSGCELSIVVTDNASMDESATGISNALKRQGYVPSTVGVPPDLASKVSGATRLASPDPDKPDVTLVLASGNLGFAGGNNIGVRLVGYDHVPDYFWFLNSDTEVDSQALTSLLEKMSRSPDVGICGSALLHASDRRTVQAYGGAMYSLCTGRAWSAGGGSIYDATVSDEWAEQRINYISGAAMLIRAELFFEVGFMSEEYFLYNEEIDLSCRLGPNVRLGVATKSIVYHRVGASIGTERDDCGPSKLSTFYQTRSKLLFAARHYPQFLPSVWLALLGRGVKYLLSRNAWGNARVIFAVLAGRRAVDPRWFSERQCRGGEPQEDRGEA